jgi:hypothetical protein
MIGHFQLHGLLVKFYIQVVEDNADDVVVFAWD